MAGYTRGECLTIDFHATLIYSRAPSSRVFRAREANSGRTDSSSFFPLFLNPPAPVLLGAPSRLKNLSSIRVASLALVPRRFMDSQDDSLKIGPFFHWRFSPDSRDLVDRRSRRSIPDGVRKGRWKKTVRILGGIARVVGIVTLNRVWWD